MEDKLKQELFFLSKEIEYLDKSFNKEENGESEDKTKLQKEFQNYSYQARLGVKFAR